MLKTIELFTLLICLISLQTMAMTQVQNQSSRKPTVIEYHYQPWFGPPISGEAFGMTEYNDTNLYSAAQSQASCDSCIIRFEKILDLIENDPRHEIDDLISALCQDIVDPTQHNTCIVKAKEVVQRVRHAVTHEIEWSPVDFCAFLNTCTIDCCSSDKPEQIYTLVGDNNRQRHFMFTMRTGTGAVLQISRAPFYNSSPSSPFTVPEPIHSFSSTSSTYTAGQWKGFIHTVFLQDMEPGQYYYRVGVPATKNWSSLFNTIIHADNIGTNGNPLRIMAFGDIDLTKYSDDTRDFITRVTQQSQNVHAALIVGDLGYSDCAERKWTPFLTWIQNVFTRNGIPLMTLPGNHESFCYLEFQGYAQRFPRSTGARKELYYSVKYGKLHINMLNSEHMTSWNQQDMTDEQLSWFATDLEAAKREGKANWYISALHRPMFCSWSYHDCGDENMMRTRLEKPFNDFGIDMVLYGHLHAFERTTQISLNGQESSCSWNADHTIEQCTKAPDNGPIYILTGAAGNSHSIPDPAEFQRKKWSSSVSMNEGIGLIIATDDTLTHQYADSTTKKIIDQVVIRKR